MNLADFNRLLEKTRKTIEEAEAYFAMNKAKLKKAPPEWLKPALRPMEENDGA